MSNKKRENGLPKLKEWQPGSVAAQVDSHVEQPQLFDYDAVEYSPTTKAAVNLEPLKAAGATEPTLAKDWGQLWLKLDMVGDTILPQSADIIQNIMPDVLSHFIKRNAEYGDDTADVLGIKGQFADINRKFWKLKRMLWDESVPEWAVSESAEEVLYDFVGHALLTIQMLRKEKGKAIMRDDR